MTKVTYRDKLGTGIYSIREAAAYSRMSPNTLRKWIYGSSNGSPVITHEYKKNSGVVSFLDVVQAIGVHQYRTVSSIPMQRIRRAVAFAEKQFGITHPFARNDVLFYWGKDVIIKYNGELYEGSNRFKGAKMFPFVNSYIQKLVFDEDTGLASKLIIHSEEKCKITMNPKVRFGEPMMPSGYTASSLMGFSLAGDSAEVIAKECGIPVHEVHAAVNFHLDYLGKKVAA